MSVASATPSDSQMNPHFDIDGDPGRRKTFWPQMKALVVRRQ
jgi:hypothetical protein